MKQRDYYLKVAVIPALALSILLAGCDKKPKVPLVGEREAVFVGDEPLKADATLSGTPVTLPQPYINLAWPTASGNPTHAMDPVKVRDALKEVWSASIGRGSDSTARLLNGPIAAENKVFVIDTTGEVTAFDLETGRQLWRTDTTPESRSTQAFSGGLAYDQGFLFVVTPNAEIVMLSAATGEVKERFALSAPVRSAPTIKNGMIYAVNINNQIEVIDYQTGQPVWSHAGIVEVAGLLGGASPAVTSDLVVVPYTSGEVYALHPVTGVPLWSDTLMSFSKLDPVSTLYHIKARPVIKDHMVYLIGNGGLMRALETNSGRVVWSQKVSGMRSPAVAGAYLFMVTNNNELACLNRLTGRIHWVRNLPRFEKEDAKSEPILWAGPIIVNDSLVLAGSHGQALIVSAKDGETRQDLELGRTTFLSPIAVQETVLFLTDTGKLIAFR
jgi:FOG: WD40-like repeat